MPEVAATTTKEVVHSHRPWEALPRPIESRAKEALNPLPFQPDDTLPFLIWLRDRYTHGNEDFAILASCRGAFPVIAGWTLEEVRQRVEDSRAGRQGFVWANAIKAARVVPIASCLRARLQGEAATEEQLARRLLHFGSATSSGLPCRGLPEATDGD